MQVFPNINSQDSNMVGKRPHTAPLPTHAVSQINSIGSSLVQVAHDRTCFTATHQVPFLGFIII